MQVANAYHPLQVMAKRNDHNIPSLYSYKMVLFPSAFHLSMCTYIRTSQGSKKKNITSLSDL